jgi:hypothetical protein
MKMKTEKLLMKRKARNTVKLAMQILSDLPTVETSWVSAGKLHCTNYLIVQTALHAKPVQ